MKNNSVGDEEKILFQKKKIHIELQSKIRQKQRNADNKSLNINWVIMPINI